MEGLSQLLNTIRLVQSTLIKLGRRRRSTNYMLDARTNLGAEVMEVQSYFNKSV